MIYAWVDESQTLSQPHTFAPVANVYFCTLISVLSWIFIVKKESVMDIALSWLSCVCVRARLHGPCDATILTVKINGRCPPHI